MEEDTEFRDLIIKKLENNGVLLKLKAALRAQVHNLIDTYNEDSSTDSNINDSAGNSHDEATTLALSLMQDLFECLELNITKSVFQSESGDKVKYACKTRTDLLDMLQLSDEYDDDDQMTSLPNSKVPVLVKYLKRSEFCSKTKDNANETFIATTSTSSIE